MCKSLKQKEVEGQRKAAEKKESKSVKSHSFTLQHAPNDQVDVKGHNPRCNHSN